MYHTENEAKGKICPYMVAKEEKEIKQINKTNGTRSESTSKYVYERCIGSRCMKWEKHEVTAGRGRCSR